LNKFNNSGLIGTAFIVKLMFALLANNYNKVSGESTEVPGSLVSGNTPECSFV